MRIKELFFESGSLLGKKIDGKTITKETVNEFWDSSFECNYINLTSLEGAPKKINGKFSCNNNEQLNSLKGISQEGVTSIYCYDCNLTTLNGAPKKINGSFDCSKNKRLTSLKGVPQEGVSSLECYGCSLTSLEGAPKIINGFSNFSKNPIITLKGVHKIIEEINGAAFFPDSIKSNILGLLKIKNLRRISFINNESNEMKSGISKIINSYLPNPSPSQIIDCQNELIDAGFEEYAEL